MHVEMEWRRAFKPLFLKKIDAECDYLFSMGDKQLFNTIKILTKSCDFPILKAFISINRNHSESITLKYQSITLHKCYTFPVSVTLSR